MKKPLHVAVLVVALTAWAGNASAATAPSFFPTEKSGWLTVGAGVRSVIQGDMTRLLAHEGLQLRAHSLVQPIALIGANYLFDPSWAMRSEFGWSQDRYLFSDGETVSVQTIMFQIAVEWIPPLHWERIQPFFQGAIGYYFSGITTPIGDLDQTETTSATGGSATVGVRVGLAPGVGLSLEERFAFAFSVLGPMGMASVGGNSVTVALYYVWK